MRGTPVTYSPAALPQDDEDDDEFIIIETAVTAPGVCSAPKVSPLVADSPPRDNTPGAGMLVKFVRAKAPKLDPCNDFNTCIPGEA